MVFLAVDHLKELVEALYLTNWNALEIEVSRVAENFGEEVPSLHIIEKEDLVFIAFHSSGLDLSVFVDPLEEKGLVWVEHWLLHKQLPEAVDVISAQGYTFVRVQHYELKEAEHLV